MISTTMASKLIIFMVLANVAQNFFDFSAAASGELPSESFGVLDKINNHMNAVIREEFIIIKDLANSLRNSTELIISGQNTGSAGSATFDITKAAERSQIELNNILAAVSIAAGAACATGDSFHSAANANVKVAADSIASAVALASAGEYPGNKDKFDQLQTDLREALLGLKQNYGDLISSCLNPANRTDIDEVIQTVKNGIETSFTLQSGYLFGMIRIYGNVVTDKNSYDIDSALTGIDSSRVNACAEFANAMAFIFGACEGFYLDRILGGTDIVEIFYVSQSLTKRALNNVNNTYDPIGTVIANTLEKRTNVKEIGRLDYFPSTLANQSATNIGLQIFTITILEAIKQTQPLSAVQAEAVILAFPAISKVFATTWFDAIVKADDDGLLCNLVPAEIELTETSQVPLIVSFVEVLFVLTGYTGITNSTAQADTIYHGKTANGFIYEASRYLSRTICAKQGATQADYMEMRRLQEQVVINMIEFTKIVLKSNLIQVLINHGYTIAGDEPSSSQNSSSLRDTFSTAFKKLTSLLDKNSLQLLGVRIL